MAGRVRARVRRIKFSKDEVNQKLIFILPVDGIVLPAHKIGRQVTWPQRRPTIALGSQQKINGFSFIVDRKKATTSSGNRIRFKSSMALYRFFKVGQHNGFLVSKLNATKPLLTPLPAYMHCDKRCSNPTNFISYRQNGDGHAGSSNRVLEKRRHFDGSALFEWEPDCLFLYRHRVNSYQVN